MAAGQGKIERGSDATVYAFEMRRALSLYHILGCLPEPIDRSGPHHRPL